MMLMEQWQLLRVRCLAVCRGHRDLRLVVNLPDDAGRQHVLFLHTSRRRRTSTRPGVWASRFTPSLSCKVAYETPSTTSPLNLSFDAVDVTGVRLEPLVCVWLAPGGCGFTSGAPCSSHLPRQRECGNG